MTSTMYEKYLATMTAFNAYKAVCLMVDADNDNQTIVELRNEYMDVIDECIDYYMQEFPEIERIRYIFKSLTEIDEARNRFEQLVYYKHLNRALENNASRRADIRILENTIARLINVKPSSISILTGAISLDI